MAIDHQAVQRQAEAEAQGIVDGILAETGCSDAHHTAKRIHQVYLGRFELRALRRGPEYCPTEGHEYIRTPCWRCPPADNRQEDDHA